MSRLHALYNRMTEWLYAAMTHCFHRFVAVFLILVLGLTGHSMAVARGMPGANGYAEYCIGETTVMVAVDETGAPTGRTHICPDYSLSLLHWVPVDVASVAPFTTAGTAVRFEADQSVVVIRIVSATARSPPWVS